MSVLKLAIDRQSRRLVNYGGTVEAFPALFQSNAQAFEITVVDPAANFTTPYTRVNMAGYGLRVSIGATPTGTSGGPTPLALQDTWTWDSVNYKFTGTLALNVAAIDSFIGSAASATAYFEVNLTISGTRETIFQETITLKAVVDELTSTSPSPSDQYLTQAEQLALFVKKVGDAGEVIVLKSPGGIYGREIGVADDGTAIDNIITL